MLYNWIRTFFDTFFNKAFAFSRKQRKSVCLRNLECRCSLQCDSSMQQRGAWRMSLWRVSKKTWQRGTMEMGRLFWRHQVWSPIQQRLRRFGWGSPHARRSNERPQQRGWPESKYLTRFRIFFINLVQFSPNYLPYMSFHVNWTRGRKKNPSSKIFIFDKIVIRHTYIWLILIYTES